jgi:hypothetical protein
MVQKRIGKLEVVAGTGRFLAKRLESLTSSDMIPALRGLSNLENSVEDSDEIMAAVNQLPKKRPAVEENKSLLFGNDLAMIPYQPSVKGGGE